MNVAAQEDGRVNPHSPVTSGNYFDEALVNSVAKSSTETIIRRDPFPEYRGTTCQSGSAWVVDAVKRKSLITVSDTLCFLQ